MGFGAGVVELGTPGRTHADAELCGSDFPKGPDAELPTHAASSLESEHRSGSSSCGLVKFLKKYLLRLCSWCIGGRGWGKEVAGGGVVV